MAVREKLDIACGEKVEFAVNEQNEVVIRPVKVSLEDIYGVLEKQKPAGTHEDLRRLAREWTGEKGSKSGWLRQFIDTGVVVKSDKFS